MKKIKMRKFTMVTALLLTALLAACLLGACASTAQKSEEERVAEDPNFSNATAMNERFLLDGSAFCVVRCETSILYPSAIGMRGVYVYIDYPAGEIYPSSALRATDIDGETYAPSAADGLDFLGEYRGETPEGLGYARFVLPKKYTHFVLTLQANDGDQSVHLIVESIDVD